MDKRPITIGARTIVPIEHLESPESALIDFTLENGAWSQGSDLPRYFAEAELLKNSDGEPTAIAFPRAADLTPWLRKSVRSKVPIVAEALDHSMWPRIELGDRTPDLGPNEHIQYDQGPAWEALKKEPFRWPFGRILALKCGAGKTCLSLRLAQHRGVRTLVICHTLNMAKQWSAEAVDLLGLPADRHGFIGDSRVEWEDRDIVFSSMPGLLCREYPPEFFYRFGLVVADEGDLLGASKMREILSIFPGERLLVTATLKRKDGNDALFYLHVGEVCFLDTEDDIIPDVYVLESPVEDFVPVISKSGKIDYKPSEQTVYNRAYRRHFPHIPKTISLLANYEERSQWCLRVVRQLLDDGRKVLFVGGRVEDLKRFHASAIENWPHKTSGLILGKQHGISAEEASDALKNSDVIWGIQQLAKRGMNERSIDTVVLQFSQFNEPGTIRQLVGRACRYHPDKKKPLVVLLNDRQVGCLDANTHKIVEQLESRGSEVTWYE